MGNERVLRCKVKRRKQILKPQLKRQKLDPNFFKTLPNEIREDTSLLKYWHNRFRLFSKFDKGIKLDKGWLKSTYSFLRIDTFYY